jgi:hypothetical protein
MARSKKERGGSALPSVRCLALSLPRSSQQGLIPPELRMVEEALSPTQESHDLNEMLSLSQAKGLHSTEIEEKHVYEVYDEIAVHWHHTRGKRKVPPPALSPLLLMSPLSPHRLKVYWHRVKVFLESLPPGSFVAGASSHPPSPHLSLDLSLVADVGCGDGKYFGVNPNIVTIGCDRSPVLLKVAAPSTASIVWPCSALSGLG